MVGRKLILHPGRLNGVDTMPDSDRLEVDVSEDTRVRSVGEKDNASARSRTRTKGVKGIICDCPGARDARLDAHRITQRHPGLRSLASRSLLYCDFAPLASSSSTISCGFTVICTTLGASRLNLNSVRLVSMNAKEHIETQAVHTGQRRLVVQQFPKRNQANRARG